MKTDKREFAISDKRSLPEFLANVKRGQKPEADEERKITVFKDRSGKVVKVKTETIK